MSGKGALGSSVWKGDNPGRGQRDVGLRESLRQVMVLVLGRCFPMPVLSSSTNVVLGLFASVLMAEVGL